MAVPFVFSMGDFLAAIELTIRIGKALRESSGATAECRLVLQDLHLLRQMLELLQSLQPAGTGSSYLNAIRGTALSCLVPLRALADKLDSSYSLLLGEKSSANLFRKSRRKIQWALFASGEVSEFRTVIAAKVGSIQVLLGACNGWACYRSMQRSQLILQPIASLFQGWRSLRKRLKSCCVKRMLRPCNFSTKSL